MLSPTFLASMMIPTLDPFNNLIPIIGVVFLHSSPEKG